MKKFAAFALAMLPIAGMVWVAGNVGPVRNFFIPARPRFLAGE